MFELDLLLATLRLYLGKMWKAKYFKFRNKMSFKSLAISKIAFWTGGILKLLLMVLAC